MSAHGQTMTWGMHIGKSTQGARRHWLQRLRQWLGGRPMGSAATAGNLPGSWDSRRERFQPPSTESAFEHAAAGGGQSWFITLHSAAL
jgi:hypothetical protein